MEDPSLSISLILIKSLVWKILLNKIMFQII